MISKDEILWYIERWADVYDSLFDIWVRALVEMSHNSAHGCNLPNTRAFYYVGIENLFVTAIKGNAHDFLKIEASHLR